MQPLPDRTKKSLLPVIVHLAAEGGSVTTDALRAYQSVGSSSCCADVEHIVVNHSAKRSRFVTASGVHTNNVEGMHSVVKRQTRRRVWKVCPKGSKGRHLQLAVFVENCKLPAAKKDELCEWFKGCKTWLKEF